MNVSPCDEISPLDDWVSVASRWGWPEDEIDYVATRCENAIMRPDQVVAVTRALITVECYLGGSWWFERGSLARVLARDRAAMDACVGRCRADGMVFADGAHDDGVVPGWDDALHDRVRCVRPCVEHRYGCRPFANGECGWKCTCDGTTKHSDSIEIIRGKRTHVVWIERDGAPCDVCMFAGSPLGARPGTRAMDRPVAFSQPKPALVVAEPTRAYAAPKTKGKKLSRTRVLAGQAALVLVR